MKYKIGNVEVEAIQWNGGDLDRFIETCRGLRGNTHFNYGDYLVTTENSTFVLSEQDFNNMATKVKEPKFKVGDKVYYIDVLLLDEIKFITGVVQENDGAYRLTDRTQPFFESELFTLEEAIEKLREL